MDAVWRTASAEETRALGCRLGRLLGPGDVVALAGGLGTGKTCFTQGIAQGLGLDPAEVVSPTYTLVREVRGRVLLTHVDLYRLAGGEEALEEIGLFDLLEEGGVTVIEWADRFLSWIPEPWLLVRLAMDEEDDSARRIRLEPRGERPRALAAALGRGGAPC